MSFVIFGQTWPRSINLISWLLFLMVLLKSFVDVESNILDVLRRHHDLAMFHDLVMKSPILLRTLEIREGTLFAPTNQAIKEHIGNIDNYTLLYHFTNVAKKVEDLTEDVITSELPGNPPIYISRKSSAEIYLNDARIDPQRKNLRATNAYGQEQVIHFIDRVLEPAFPQTMTSSLYNPDAARFIEQSSQYNITGIHRITDFAKQVAFQNRINTFRNSGRHTFFIPVDEAFKRITIKSVDAKVIDGHVIPNAVIFLRSAEIGAEYKTEAFASNLPVFVSFGKQRVNEQEEWIVKSDTRSADGDQFHRKGVVQTEVVKGNIPVRNGVVHLISKPLVLIDSTVYQTLANGKTFSNEKSSEKDDKDVGPMKEFFNLINDYASEEFKAVIQNPNPYGITVFVPTNEALQMDKINQLKSNKTQLEEILRLHIILRTVTSDNITEGSINEREPYQVPSFDPNKKLYFNVMQRGSPNRQFFVEGGGSNATITQADIGATNGVIHMIDRVLGVSDQTVFEKLRTDPMLQKTFHLTSQENFNLKFKDIHGRFTLFAPSDAAWEKIYRTAPSEYKKLFMGDYGYHVGKIMERHMMVNQVFNIEELRQLSKNSTEGMYPIPAVHGFLRVKHREDIDWRKLQRDHHFANDMSGSPFAYDYAVFWNFIRAQVIRPNVECTNGVIHVIDNVLMSPADVTVNRAEPQNLQSLSSLILTLVPLIMARLLQSH